MQDSLGISAMMWEDGRIVCGMVVVGGGHVGEGAGDAVPRAGMVAPAPGVHEGEGEIAVDMVRVAAGLVDEGRDGMLLKVGAVHAGAEGVDEPGGEDRIHPLDFVTKVRGGITHAEGGCVGRRRDAARTRGVRCEGRTGRGTALGSLRSVRGRAERGGTGVEAGGTVGGCGSCVDGRELALRPRPRGAQGYRCRGRWDHGRLRELRGRACGARRPPPRGARGEELQGRRDREQLG